MAHRARHSLGAIVVDPVKISGFIDLDTDLYTMTWPSWWPWGRAHRRRLAEAAEKLAESNRRVAEAERAARVAHNQWPAVRRAQHGFAADMQSAMRRHRPTS